MALFYYDHKYIIFILCRIICYGKIVVAHLCMRHLPPRRIIVVADLSSADAISLDFRLDRPFIYPLRCRCCFCGLLFKSVSSVFKFLFQGVFHLPVQCLVKFCITAKKSRCMQRLYRVLNSATYLFLHIHRLKNCQRGSSTYI